MESLPKQIVADGDYTNHASVQAAESSKVDFYGSWQDSWKPTEPDAHGRSGAFISSAFRPQNFPSPKLPQKQSTWT